jgi:hypothetical protein
VPKPDGLPLGRHVGRTNVLGARPFGAFSSLVLDVLPDRKRLEQTVLYFGAVEE